MEKYLEEMTSSSLNCVSASGDQLQMGKQGKVKYNIMDTGGSGRGFFEMDTTVHTSPNLPVPLFPVDQMYSTGNWDFLLRDPKRGGAAFVGYDKDNNPIHNLPLQYDYENKCTWVEYGMGSMGGVGDKTKYEKTGKNNRTAFSNLINCVNSLPSLEDMYRDLMSSELVECLTYVNHIGSTDDINVGGAKRGMRSDKKKAGVREFHKDHGHLGSCGGGELCEICVRKRGNKFPLRASQTPVKDFRPGYRWYLDAICWDEENGEGDRYTFSMRDECTGLYKTFNTSSRSDFQPLFEEWVKTVRSSPYTQQSLSSPNHYSFISEVHTDFDGVFREDNKGFVKSMGGLGVKVSYLPPEHHEGPGERQVGVLEETTKALLMERNLPGKHWGECVRAAEFLLNRYALSHDSPSSDGDAPRPLERFTGGRYSRRRIDRELGYYLGPGTLALVHDNRVKGSDMEAKTRFGVACGMEGDIVLFKCPYNHRKFRSKSYTVIRLPNFVNYYQFLSITEPNNKNRNCHIRPKEIRIRAEEKAILSHLPSTRSWDGDRLRDVKFLDRLTYEEEDDGESEEGKVFDGREYILTGDPPTKPQLTIAKGKEVEGEGKKRYRENPSYRLKLQSGSIPQRDYELQGEEYVGRSIVKEFGEDEYRGVIVGCDVNRENGDEMWVVEYEDGDGEDLNHQELLRVLIPEDLEEMDRPMAGWVCEKGWVTKEKGTGEKGEETKRMKGGGEEEKRPQIIPTMWTSAAPSPEGVRSRGQRGSTSWGRCEGGGGEPQKQNGQGGPHPLGSRMGGRDYRSKKGGEPLEQGGGGPNNSPKPTHNSYTTTGTQNYIEACKRMGMGKTQYKVYYDSLPSETKKLFQYPFMKGKTKADKLRGGIVLPHPSTLPKFAEGMKGYYRAHELPVPVRLIRDAVSLVEEQLRGEKEGQEVRVLMVSKLTGKVVAPGKVQEAYDWEDLELWIDSWDKEMEGLQNMGHITHGHTKGDLLKMNITSPPVSTRMISDAKYKGHVFEKRKGRMIVQGFKEIPGVHYDGKVFTPAPSQYTQKILMAFVAGKGFKVKSWDVGQAYTWGERVKPIALSYPVGFKRRGDNGEELFMVAHRQHYGEKGAGRGWGKTRTQKIREMYNTASYSCHVCSSDPCLNVVVKWGGKGKPNNVGSVKVAGVGGASSVGGGGSNLSTQPPPSHQNTKDENEQNLAGARARQRQSGWPADFAHLAKLKTGMIPHPVDGSKDGVNGDLASDKKVSPAFHWKNYPRGAELSEEISKENSKKCSGPSYGSLTPDGNSLPLPSYATVEQIESWGGVVSYLSVYTDDIDCVGPDEGVLEEIFQTMHKIWPSREVDSGFMLGIKRDFYEEKGVKKVRLSQPDFLENAFEGEFAMYSNPYLEGRKKLPRTPLPPGTFISKANAGKDAEEVKTVQDMGYMKLCGILIWACRGTIPEASFAVSQVCKLMSCPSFKSFELGIQILAYMYGVRKRGIVFRQDGNPEPIIMSDASFKVDPFTGKTQYGTHVLLYGGPIVVVSKKIPHVSLSTPHAELCAMNYAARTGAWLHNVFIELGLPIQQKTLLLGDNSVAILNASEDIVSEKNKYVQLSYYYIREREAFLEICHLRTDKLLSDLHTKAVSSQTLDSLVGYSTGTAEEPFRFQRPRAFK